MESKAKLALAIGGGVLALGAAVGVGALAASLGGGDSASAPAGMGQGRDGGAPNGRGGMDTTALARTLATKLGVDETEMAAALEEVMAAARPSGQPSGRPSGQPSSPPSGTPGGGSEYLETMAKALAQKLDLDEAEVLAALQESMAVGRDGQSSSEPTG